MYCCSRSVQQGRYPWSVSSFEFPLSIDPPGRCVKLFVRQCSIDWDLHISGLVCRRQVSRAWISNDIPEYLWDVITYPCPRYMPLAQKSSFILTERKKIASRHREHWFFPIPLRHIISCHTSHCNMAGCEFYWSIIDIWRLFFNFIAFL